MQARDKKEAEEKAARQAEEEKRAKEEERARRMKNQPASYRRRVFSDFMETSGRVHLDRVIVTNCMSCMLLHIETDFLTDGLGIPAHSW